jgi:hypothetical protein|tara:strand:+ start:11986 stop:12567 length:582 start_codon:yes stop_codon:yes gene_type:complete
MPSFSSKVQLSTSAKNSNIVLADVDRIKGAFKTYVSASVMNATSVNYFSDKQILWVEDSGSLFQANVLPADYENTFVDTVTFKPFSYVTGSFISASLSGNNLQLFGQDLSGSDQISMSVDLTAIAGTGDITSVVAGFGLSGGAISGEATLNVDTGSLAGLGLSAGSSSDILLNTGSVHFTEAIQKTNLDGGEV